MGLTIGCSGGAVRKELNKGRVELPNSDLTKRVEYSADVGQQKHDYAGTNTITCDNGCENLDFEGIERSVLTKSKYTMLNRIVPGKEAQMRMPTNSFEDLYRKVLTLVNSLIRELR